MKNIYGVFKFFCVANKKYLNLYWWKVNTLLIFNLSLICNNQLYFMRKILIKLYKTNMFQISTIMTLSENIKRVLRSRKT